MIGSVNPITSEDMSATEDITATVHPSISTIMDPDESKSVSMNLHQSTKLIGLGVAKANNVRRTFYLRNGTRFL